MGEVRMRDVCEGMRAVCAVLEELEPRMPEAPVLRLAEWHLRLLAKMLAARAKAFPETEAGHGDAGEPGAGALRVAAPEGGIHARQ